MAVLCDPCWNELANHIAQAEGATAPLRADPDPDDPDTPFPDDPDPDGWDPAPHSPPTCPECNAPVRHFPTNYDRWVYLAVADTPAKNVPRRYRWRLKPLYARHSLVPTDIIAIRINGIDPAPSELVTPAHRAVCLSADALHEVEQARIADLRRHQHADEDDFQPPGRQQEAPPECPAGLPECFPFPIAAAGRPPRRDRTADRYQSSPEM